jgi:hypothetical protein
MLRFAADENFSLPHYLNLAIEASDHLVIGLSDHRDI